MDNVEKEHVTQDKKKQKKLSLKQLALSILAAMFGVQSDKNRNRDFQSGDPKHFIIGGIIFVIIFLVVVYNLVQLALA